jgi:hypothetical protein
MKYICIYVSINIVVGVFVSQLKKYLNQPPMSLEREAQKGPSRPQFSQTTGVG